MKRSLVVALIVGALVSAIVIALHATGITLPLEELVMSLVLGQQTTTKTVGRFVQYLIVIVLAFSVVWLVLNTSRRKRLGWPLGLLALELVTLAWVCLLYQVFFQPIPSLLAVGLGFAGATGYANQIGRSRSTVVGDLFGGRVSEEQLSRLASGEVSYEREPRMYQVTAVVCDIANKHELAEDGPPAELADVTEKFIRHATESLLNAGAYIEAANGEGIVALFGFPQEDAEQADKATRHALALLESFEKRRASGNDDAFKRFDVHVGVSSGTVVIAPLQPDGRVQLLTAGEPVELARRFCIANRFYGTSVLIGPQTFELTSKTVLARPIDFLSGVDVRERHEIYEPLTLAANASAEEVARRDAFWNGVVLYREKRWAESYTQFQAARGPNGRDDRPLHLYLRRIEPLALHLAMTQEE
jgi:adenylate cyclase